MAGSDSGEKIYPPSEEKLRKLRKEEGQWFKSRDLAGAVVLAAAAGFCTFGLGFLGKLLDVYRFTLDPERINRDIGFHLESAIQVAWQTLIGILFPLGILLFVLSGLTMFLQVGALFSVKTVSLRFEAVNPGQGLKRIFFSGKTYQQLALNILKLAIVIVLVYFALQASLRDLLLSSRHGLAETTRVFTSALSALLWKCAGVYLLLGGADYLIQRRSFMKDQGMTEEEVRREFREQEMPPEARQRLAERRRELLDASTEGGIDTANRWMAVTVNPTHLAIGIEYNPDEDIPLGRPPRVAAKGSGPRAAEIVRRARALNIRVIRNVPLTRSLFKVRLGRAVPPELFQAMDLLIQELDILSQDEEQPVAAGEREPEAETAAEPMPEPLDE